MRLINTTTLQLEEFFDSDRPPYAILSHTWGRDEVNFQEWLQWEQEAKRGFQKIKSSCQVACRHNFRYIWVDTNCVNKKSSAELSEGINSMFVWYRDSDACMVYLEDFTEDTNDSGSDDIGKSRWFTRGWTLQELLAPERVGFFDCQWRYIGDKLSLAERIASATGIEGAFLVDRRRVMNASVAQKMYWASCRETTRTEDMAYCLLGLFSINMPLLYGEGNEAFRRLQEEIMKVSTDQSLFAWGGAPKASSPRGRHWVSVLASHPSAFGNCNRVVTTAVYNNYHNHECRREFSLTNLGLNIDLPIISTTRSSTLYGALSCRYAQDVVTTRICIPFYWGDDSKSHLVRSDRAPFDIISLPLGFLDKLHKSRTMCILRASELRSSALARREDVSTEDVSFAAFEESNCLQYWSISSNNSPVLDFPIPVTQTGTKSAGVLISCQLQLLDNLTGTCWKLLVVWDESLSRGTVSANKSQNGLSNDAYDGRKGPHTALSNSPDPSILKKLTDTVVCGRLKVKVGFRYGRSNERRSYTIPVFFCPIENGYHFDADETFAHLTRAREILKDIGFGPDTSYSAK
ncbi:Vegetative incompatibility protein HET-E-1 [Colletotrichum sidae]|uniref:Vegetative incompatibility protein HET-E-1 n=1 Tax=Colletotrichum sidae TaxID=1347389 RepID=A0A4R8TI78_9PEZI|nr:Vegetative incompatibility protein HET-E-1 [Colletotrichum sidae]